jgi:hypothetical protein
VIPYENDKNNHIPSRGAISSVGGDGRAARNEASQLISAALAEFFERRREDLITQKLNEVYQQDAPGLDPVLLKMQFSRVTAEEW